jgi:hypothetical protein
LSEGSSEQPEAPDSQKRIEPKSRADLWLKGDDSLFTKTLEMQNVIGPVTENSNAKSSPTGQKENKGNSESAA